MKLGSVCTGYGYSVTMPKGVYDRSASAWKPKPKKEYDPVLVARVREFYEVQKMTMAEVAAEVGVSVRVLQVLMPRYGIERRPAVKRDQRGSNNSYFKGASAGYTALHLRVSSLRGQPQYCAACDRTAADVRYEWANLSGHYDDVNDFVRLCKLCHAKFDQRMRYALGRRLWQGEGR